MNEYRLQDHDIDKHKPLRHVHVHLSLYLMNDIQPAVNT